MCGIAGIVGPLSAGSTAETVAGMTRALTHRGPDDQGVAPVSDGVIGMARLRIRSRTAELVPMRTGTGAAAYNGEIYGVWGPDGSLGAPPAGGPGEIEALLGSRHGADGMFALAAELGGGAFRLERDPFGIKPLYLRRTGRALAFASEIAPLRAAFGEPGIDRDALDDVLIFGRPLGERTVFHGIERLPPGGRLTLRDGAGATMRVAGPGGAAARSGVPGLDALDAALRDSVGRCLIADRPVGIAVSGGIDSGLVAAYAAESGIRDVTVLSVRTEGVEDGLDSLADLGLPRGIPEGWRHVGVPVGPERYARAFAEAAGVLGEPTRMSSAALYLALAEACAEHGVRVLLAGEGADELFMGYASHVAVAPALVAGGALAGGELKDMLLAFAAPPTLRAELEGLIGPRRVAAGLDRLRARLSTEPDEPACLAFRRLECALSLEPLLHRTDHALMRYSVEGRVPFLHGVVPGLAFQFRGGDLVRDGLGKAPLRALATRRLTPSAAARGKVPFRAPLADWLAGPLRGWAGSILSSAACFLSDLGISPGAADALLARVAGGESGPVGTVTALLSLALWHRSIEGGPTLPEVGQ